MVMPKLMTPGLAGPCGAISTKISNLTSKITINNATMLHNYRIGITRNVSFEVGCCIGPKQAAIFRWPMPFLPIILWEFFVFLAIQSCGTKRGVSTLQEGKMR
jgi:hypothetical protein